VDNRGDNNKNISRPIKDRETDRKKYMID